MPFETLRTSCHVAQNTAAYAHVEKSQTKQKKLQSTKTVPNKTSCEDARYTVSQKISERPPLSPLFVRVSQKLLKIAVEDGL